MLRTSYCVLRNFEDEFNGFRRILRTVDDVSVFCGGLCELVEMLFEIFDHLGADGMGALTPLAPVGERFEGVDPPRDAPFRVEV